MNCQVYSELPASVFIKCGFYEEYKKGIPHHELYLSDKAARELWEKNKNLVGMGLYHWVANNPDNIRGKQEVS
jgi:hypothetical protein